MPPRSLAFFFSISHSSEFFRHAPTPLMPNWCRFSFVISFSKFSRRLRRISCLRLPQWFSPRFSLACRFSPPPAGAIIDISSVAILPLSFRLPASLSRWFRRRRPSLHAFDCIRAAYFATLIFAISFTFSPYCPPIIDYFRSFRFRLRLIVSCFLRIIRCHASYFDFRSSLIAATHFHCQLFSSFLFTLPFLFSAFMPHWFSLHFLIFRFIIFALLIEFSPLGRYIFVFLFAISSRLGIFFRHDAHAISASAAHWYFIFLRGFIIVTALHFRYFRLLNISSFISIPFSSFISLIRRYLFDLLPYVSFFIILFHIDSAQMI